MYFRLDLTADKQRMEFKLHFTMTKKDNGAQSDVKVSCVKFRLFLQMMACQDLERKVRKWT